MMYQGRLMYTPTTLPASLHSPFHPGEVALVGAGPGDLRLLTLRAWSPLMQADAVVFDRLISAEMLALIPLTCARHYVGKASGCHSLSQDQLNELLAELADQGQRGGAPQGRRPVYLRPWRRRAGIPAARGVPCQVVPGTCASGCSAYAGIPLTHRDLVNSLPLRHRAPATRWRVEAALGQPCRAEPDAGVLHGPVEPRADRRTPGGAPAGGHPSGADQQRRASRPAGGPWHLRQLPTMAADCEPGVPTLTVIGHVVNLFAGAALHFPASLSPAREAVAV